MSQRDAEKLPVPSEGGKPPAEGAAAGEGAGDDGAIRALDEGDIAILKTYVRAGLFRFCIEESKICANCRYLLQGQGPYTAAIKETEADITKLLKTINEISGMDLRCPS